MALQRESTPPPRSNMDFDCPRPPSTPGPSNSGDSNGSTVMGSLHTSVPPSPGVSDLTFAAAASTSFDNPCQSQRVHTTLRRKQGGPRGAGVRKLTPKKSEGILPKAVRSTLREGAIEKDRAVGKYFRFLDLPGEIRNLVYQHTHSNLKQALLVHRPRLACLRPRTRLDRARPMASDLIEQENDRKMSIFNKEHCDSSSDLSTNFPRETNRPFVGLTQICRLVRHEYRPIYLAKQEIGMDLTNIVTYLQTFYFNASDIITELPVPGARTHDAPFTGNLTIAVGNRTSIKESPRDGVEVFPLLDIWANSYKIEAGFGRYLKQGYAPETDGEAKDLYRLFGRRVLHNHTCSPMNALWRTTLRSRSLASVRIHRQPAPRPVHVQHPSRFGITTFPWHVPRMAPKPYIHIIFKKTYAESWMDKFEAEVPTKPDWLAERGFGDMEYFDVKVGVEQ